MSRKSLDPRIVNLALRATSEVTAVPAMTSPEPGAPFSTPDNPWPWADVTVTVALSGVTHQETVTGTWGGPGEFAASREYQQTLVRAYTGLLAKLDKAVVAAKRLGPAPVKESAR